MTSQLLDFSKDEAPAHTFLVLSIEGCDYCEELWDFYDMVHRMDGRKTASIRCEKIDVNALVRGMKETKEGFVKYLKATYGYKPRADGRVMFPLVIHNGRHIGGYKDGKRLFGVVMQATLG